MVNDPQNQKVKRRFFKSIERRNKAGEVIAYDIVERDRPTPEDLNFERVLDNFPDHLRFKRS